MPIIKERSIQDLKHRVNIADVVSRTVALKKAGGARFKGLCPFHAEKTPSFHVSSDRGFYKCFGCGKAGDILSFVMETEGLAFGEAAEALAKRFGVTLEYEEGSGGPTKEERSLRQEIFDIHDVAAEHYRQAFLAPNAHGQFIRDYWERNRRFTAELADDFKIGFAPVDDSALAAALMKKRFSEDALRQCGLFFVREGAMLTMGALRPRFRGRLMIPIRDHQGRVVAFTARQLELTPADDPAREAKYTNSPETPIFTKSNLLFNLDRARTNVGEGKPFVMVEGQLDALRCWSVGLKTAIAPQGTSITDGQLLLLRRYHSQVECFFDSDAAGQKAALRFLPLALRAGLEVRFLMLAGAEKLDPDLLFLERGLAAYEQVRAHSLSAAAFACRSVLPDPHRASPREKAEAARQVRYIFDHADSQIARMAYFRESAHLLGILDIRSIDAETNVMAGVATPSPAQLRTFNREPGAPSPSANDSAIKSTEHDLLFLGLHHDALFAQLATQLPPDWIDTSTLPGRLLDRFLNEAQHNGWAGRENLDQLLEDQEEKTLVASLLFDQPDLDTLGKVVNEGIRSMQRRFLEPRLRQIELEIAAKAPDGDPDLLSLLKQRAEMTRQLLHPPTLTLIS